MSEEPIEATFGSPVEPDYLRPVYANQLNVNFTPHDFRLTFSLATAPFEVPDDVRDEGRLVLRPTAVASVVIPASLMHATLSVLRSQFERYMVQFGPPGLDPQGPGGHDDE